MYTHTHTHTHMHTLMHTHTHAHTQAHSYKVNIHQTQSIEQLKSSSRLGIHVCKQKGLQEVLAMPTLHSLN